MKNSVAELAWMRDWGLLLRNARQVAGLTLAELSARTGLSKGYLSKLESGHENARNPSRATLAALARALPSFRPLALMLEPAPPQSPALAAAAPELPPVLRFGPDEEASGAPLELGWRELEVLVAALLLERAALVQPMTAVTLGRVIGRPPPEITAVLDRLVAMELLARLPPVRIGAAPHYARTPEFALRLGVERLGDALVLAAALLTRAPAKSAPQS